MADFYVLKKRQLLKYPLKTVFSFFERPENLKKITPPKLGFKILTPSPVQMKEGALIDYTVTPFLITLHWTTLIKEYKPPYFFADTQIKGPYKFWHHTHTFEETPDGTWITDEVKYQLPFGILGKLAHRLWVKKQLKNIIKNSLKNT